MELHHFYRSLDLLAEHKESIELELFNRTQTYFDLKVDMIFWDTPLHVLVLDPAELIAKMI
ncbi:MAG TPA: hypothetical protein DCZ10_02715 [Pelotomaculum sp.]|nr:hypothetical protein [Pelotomaculum sp.]